MKSIEDKLLGQLYCFAVEMIPAVLLVILKALTLVGILQKLVVVCRVGLVLLVVRMTVV